MARQTIKITRSTVTRKAKAQTPSKKTPPKRCPSCGKFTSK